MSTNSKQSRKSPTHSTYSVREYDRNGERDSAWTRIGVAWAHKDGDGFDIMLDALPVSGRITLRKNKPNE